MEFPDVLLWLFVVLGIAWTIFLIVVMVAVLNFTKQATPYFERLNSEQRRVATAKDRAEHPWAYE